MSTAGFDTEGSARFWYQKGIEKPSALDEVLANCERDLTSKYKTESVRWNSPAVGHTWLSVLAIMPRPHPNAYYEERIERLIKALILHKLREANND